MLFRGKKKKNTSSPYILGFQQLIISNELQVLLVLFDETGMNIWLFIILPLPM